MYFSLSLFFEERERDLILQSGCTHKPDELKVERAKRKRRKKIEMIEGEKGKK